MSPVSHRIGRLLIALRYPLLGVAAIAAVLAFAPSRNLDFDRSIEKMFADDDPLLGPYWKLKRTFGGNEVVMVVYRDENLLAEDRQGIERLQQLGNKIKLIDGVKEILSLAELDRLIKLFATEGIVSSTSVVARQAREVFQGYTHGSDGTTAGIVCILKPDEQRGGQAHFAPKTSQNEPIPGGSRTGSQAGRVDLREAAIQRIREVTQELPAGFPQVMIAGEPVMVVDGFRYVEQDGRRLGRTSTVLLALVIVICFRSVRWVIIPVVVVQLTLLLTQAILVWSGLQLSMVSSMLTAIVTVVGVATVVHVIIRFREIRFSGAPVRDALVSAIALLAMPVFWACATDAVGFGSLLVTKVGPVQDFGIMMAIGSLLVLAGVALTIPGLGSVQLPRWASRLDCDPQFAWREQVLQLQLKRLVTWVERHPIGVGLVTLIVIGLATAGILRVDVESDFTKNFRSGSVIVRSYNFVETNLGGAGVWDVILPAPEELDWSYLKKTLALEDRLRNEVVLSTADGQQRPGLTKVISIADLVVASSPIHPENIAETFLVTKPRRAMVSASLAKMRQTLPVFMEALYGEDPEEPGKNYFRIMLRAQERQSSKDKKSLIRQVERICQEEFPVTESMGQAEVTGFFVLLTNLIDSLLADQWLAFGVASAGIGLMMFVAMLLTDVQLPRSIVDRDLASLLLILLRSIVMAMILLVPNALPIVMVLGSMGWLGMKINMGAAMIAAVSMGLSIDSSIHYAASFRRARAAGKSVTDSLAVVQQSVGLAVVFSTLALIVGFSILCTSDFVPTIYFGLLVSLSMLGGSFGNLLVLPLLLKLATRDYCCNA